MRLQRLLIAALFLLPLVGCTGGSGGGSGQRSNDTNLGGASPFLRDCLNAAAPPAVKRTVQSIQSAVNDANCRSADKALAVLTTLDLSGRGISTVTTLAGLSALVDLRLDDNPDLVNVEPLATVSKLASVSLDGTRVSQGLRSLARVKRLSMARSQLSDLSALRPLCGSLESLVLDDNQISSLNGISTCTSLRELHVSGNPLPSLSAVAAFTQLRTLRADRNQLTSITAVASLTALINFSAVHNPLLDLSPLAGLSSLVSLRVSPAARSADQCPTGSNVVPALSDYCSGNGG